MRTRLIVLFLLLLVTGVAVAQEGADVTITSPTDGTVLQDLNNIVVSGTATNVFEGNVVVQLRDVGENVLVEQPTTAPGTMGGTGEWSITLAVDVSPGIPGSIRAFSTSPQDGSVVAEDIVNIQYGETLPTTITITAPTSGEVLPNAGSFTVEGTATNVFEGNVVVQARDADGNVLVEQPTTAEGAMGGTGTWAIGLSVNVPAGTTGDIRAYSTSPQDGSVVAEAIVNVQYGPIGIPDAELNITSPANGAFVPTASGINVTGTTRDLITGDVLVQIQDASNNVLAERTVSTSATSGTGNWQALLTARFAADTNGAIRATAPGAGEGGVVVSDIVFVTFQQNCAIRTDWPIYTVVRGDFLNSIARRIGSSVNELAQANCLNNTNIISVGQQLRVPRLPQTQITPEPQQSIVVINAPQENAVLDTSGPVTVSGTGSGLFEGTVIVQALDASNNVLAGQPTTLSAGASGVWQTTLQINAAGTTGRIIAFSTSPQDGSVIASDSVNVTYGTGEGAEMMIEITSPQANTELDLSGPIAISGTSSGLFEGNLVVRVLDNEGNVLAEELTTASTDGTWTLELDIDVEEGIRGTILAYAQSPRDGLLVAVDAVNVIFGIGGAGPVVTITDPLPYTMIAAEDSFKVSGLGESLFENTLVVQVLDAGGNVLFEEPTLLNTDDFEGAGEWEIEIPAIEAPLTRGKIVAFATSPEDGSIVTRFSIDVIIGDPAEGQFVTILTPLPQTKVSAGSIGVAGYAGGVTSGQVTVQIINADGDILASQSAQVDADTGLWEAALTVVAVEPDTQGRLLVFASGPGGSVLAQDGIDLTFTE